jgi:hypothetical protein
VSIAPAERAGENPSVSKHALHLGRALRDLDMLGLRGEAVVPWRSTTV